VSDDFVRTFRLESVRAATWPSLAVCLMVVIYALATWDAPHRTPLLALVGVCLAAAVAARLLGFEKLAAGPHPEVLFVSWSGSLVVLITAACLLDGGLRSPLAALFFLPLVFAALSYPTGSMLLVATVDVAGYLAVAGATAHADGAGVFVFGAVLAIAAWICAWQCRNHGRHRRELDRVSRTDPLTGVLNRRGFRERFDAELSRARRHGDEVALVLIDLDRFKAVNDNFGHAAGDELLCWVADRLRRDLRSEDLVARLGGDEFALVLPGSDAAVAVERVTRLLAERTPASAGVAVYPVDGVDADALHQVADAQLYEHKHGRNPRGADTRRELSWAAALAAAVDERMAVQHEHSSAVSGYAGAIARELGWPEDDVAQVRLAAMLHDVGKVRVPEAILRKPRPLDADEWAEIAKHPVVGAEIVARVEGLDAIGPWIRHSHERLDGAGYPDGLAGEQIPLASRILLVADAFDAMTSDRSYRAAMTREAALAELETHAGTQFDPACVAALKTALAATASVAG
jgi:diguanylate cyclase (GGDEF)-like protein/putative nucleotidyltransferase with HDIG domain